MIVPQRILVTGASGFVGSWLVKRLSSSLPPDTEVLATGYSETGKVRGAQLDITHVQDVDDVVRRFRPTCLVHLAAVSSVREAQTERRKAWDVNLLGTMNLAEATIHHAPEARFIYASSSEIYGASFNAAGGPVDETAKLDPLNHYAATKAAADLMLGQMASDGLKVVRFRLFNHTGPGQSTRFVVPSFAAQIAAAERGESPPVLRTGNLDVRRDFLDVRDVVEAYRLAILASDLPSGVVLNIASGLSRRIGDVLEALLQLSHRKIEVEPDEALMRPVDVPVMAGDARCARELLGWRPTIPWDTTLRDILDAHRRPVSRSAGANSPIGA